MKTPTDLGVGPMYEDVPTGLTIYVRDHAPKFIDPDGTRDLMHLAAAAAVIRVYTGREVLSHDQETFMGAEIKEDGNLSFVYQSRISNIGEALQFWLEMP